MYMLQITIHTHTYSTGHQIASMCKVEIVNGMVSSQSDRSEVAQQCNHRQEFTPSQRVKAGHFKEK